ncbi:CGBP1 protein, partial [Polypterus senegalus]
MNDPTSSKRQSTITGCNEQSTAAKDTLVMELVEAFMAANIPLEKVDNPTMRSFMQKNPKGGGGIPQANTLRELYVTRIFNQQQANIIAKLAGQKVVVIANETTDVVGRYAVNVLIQPLLNQMNAQQC